MTAQLTGLDALAKIDEIADQHNAGEVVIEQPPIESKADDKPELPIGFAFITELKQRHMLTYYEEQERNKPEIGSRFADAQRHTLAAIKAGWFATPMIFAVSQDDPNRDAKIQNAQREIGNMSWQDVEAIGVAVLKKFSQTVNTPKN